MTLCPVALAIGCKKCPIVRICPVKTLIGDYKPGQGGQERAATAQCTLAHRTQRHLCLRYSPATCDPPGRDTLADGEGHPLG